MGHRAGLGRDSNAEVGTNVAPRSRSDLDDGDTTEVGQKTRDPAITTPSSVVESAPCLSGTTDRVLRFGAPAVFRCGSCSSPPSSSMWFGRTRLVEPPGARVRPRGRRPVRRSCDLRARCATQAPDMDFLHRHARHAVQQHLDAPSRIDDTVRHDGADVIPRTRRRGLVGREKMGRRMTTGGAPRRCVTCSNGP